MAKSGGLMVKRKHNVKINNKRCTKLMKRGKLKPKGDYHGSNSFHQIRAVQSKQDANNYEPEKPTTLSPDCSDEDDIGDMMDSEYLHESSKISVFCKNINDLKKKEKSTAKKRKHSGSESSSDESDGEVYEKSHKSTFKKNDFQYLLPLRSKDGVILQMRNAELKQNEVVTNQYNPSDIDQMIDDHKQTPELTVDELILQREQNLAEIKKKISWLSCSVIENPEGSTKQLKELLQMFHIKNATVSLTVKKLVAISLLDVFCDIIPSYRIRPPTEKERQQKLKKETKKLQTYEEALLRHYKNYLINLEAMLTGFKEKSIKHLSETKKKSAYKLGTVAINCFCKLLSTHFSFNYSDNIIQLLVPYMAHKDSRISNACCHAFQTMYKQDKLGDLSLIAVKITNKFIKSKNYNISENVIKTFLYLHIEEANLKQNEAKKPNMKDIRGKLKMMSRKERRRQKKMLNLEKELLETEATESREKKTKTHTEILKCIFFTYFYVLKNNEKLNLLTPVLEGVSKFAHLINIDFFDDLVSVLYGLIESRTLTDYEILLCLHSVFTILSGQGEALNIDPQGFYSHLYKSLLNLNIQDTNCNIFLLLKCLEIMITKRIRKVTNHRILAFIKRLCTILLQVPHASALGFSSFVQKTMQNFKQSDILLDNENTLGSGFYLPELNEPEHCNAFATALWELQLLSKHYHPLVAQCGYYLLSGKTAGGESNFVSSIIQKSPTDVYKKFSECDFSFLDAMIATKFEIKPKKKLKRLISNINQYENSVLNV